MFKNITLTALILSGALAAAPVFAADEHNTVAGLTAAGAPLGLHGVDPVAFINIGNRIEGTAQYAAVHDGVAYYMSSQENLDAFNENPAHFTPQNGGFCTFGVSVGKKFDGNPHYAAVENGKLYVFLNEQIYQMFQKDQAGTIKKAEGNWKKIQHTAATEL
ncbi:MAG: hypothetical protein KKA36_04680 [Gammaproteobacteria bacterium]|nr:hypothetical protein [Gammaproteobacteria bacterium]